VVTSSQHVYEVRPRKDHRGVDLISDALPFGRLWYGEPDAISNAIGYAKFCSRSHDAVVRVYDEASTWGSLTTAAVDCQGQIVTLVLFGCPSLYAASLSRTRVALFFLLEPVTAAWRVTVAEVSPSEIVTWPGVPLSV
jgi:hypothetical protein